MTAAAADRILSRFGDGAVENLELPMGASTTVYCGTLISLDQSGYAFPATAALTRRPIGVATEGKANAGSAGAKTIRVERGCFGFVNSAGDDAISIADVGQPVYVVDDQTVARTSNNGTRPYAGRVARIENSLVFVEVGFNIDPTARDLLLEAGGDLSSSQFLMVKLDSNGDVVIASAAGENVVGVLQNAPAAGAIAIVRVFGASRVIAGGVVAAGALFATTSAGKSKVAVAGTVNTSDAGATSDPLVGSYVMGHVLTVGASDAQHSVFINPMGMIPTTAA
jgi:hypothetical protein